MAISLSTPDLWLAFFPRTLGLLEDKGAGSVTVNGKTLALPEADESCEYSAITELSVSDGVLRVEGSPDLCLVKMKVSGLKPSFPPVEDSVKALDTMRIIDRPPRFPDHRGEGEGHEDKPEHDDGHKDEEGFWYREWNE